MPYTFNENCIDCEKCAERCAAGAVIVLRALLSFLIHFELRSEKEGHKQD